MAVWHLTMTLTGGQANERARTKAQGVAAMFGVILHHQHMAHDRVDLAGLPVDDLHQIVHGLVPVAQQTAAHLVDGGDAKGPGQFGVQCLQRRQATVGRHGEHIDRRGAGDAEELFLHGGYPLLS